VPTTTSLPQLLACTHDAALGEAVERMLAHRCHRCFVVDGSGCPVDVVTFTDVIACVYRTEREDDPQK